MSLEARVTFADRGVELSLSLADREVVALLGPNGAGKSTLLMAIAGLLRPDEGRIVLDGDVLFDSAAGIWVPPHRRGVALLAQEPLLFPHLTARENVAFGPRTQGVGRRTAAASAESWLHEVEAGDLADRPPGALSGGQAQRVAIARALATSPRLLLLDEPMAALDHAVAAPVRQLLHRVMSERSALVVTHDLLDALLLARRIVVVEDGRVVEDAQGQELVRRPRSGFAAGLAGLNLTEGFRTASGLTTAEGLRVDGVAEEAMPLGVPCLAVFSPAAVAIYRDPPTGSPRNVFTEVVVEVVRHGDLVRVHGATVRADITPAAAAELRLLPGVAVSFVVKAAEVTVYAA